jgi:hypothetical protein
VSRAAIATLTSWPSTARTACSKASSAPGRRSPGWGEPLADAPGYVLFPTPEALSRADPQGLKALGMPSLQLTQPGVDIRRCRQGQLAAERRPGEVDQRLRAAKRHPPRDWPLDGKLLCPARLAGEGYLFAGRLPD